MAGRSTKVPARIPTGPNGSSSGGGMRGRGGTTTGTGTAAALGAGAPAVAAVVGVAVPGAVVPGATVRAGAAATGALAGRAALRAVTAGTTGGNGGGLAAGRADAASRALGVAREPVRVGVRDRRVVTLVEMNPVWPAPAPGVGRRGGFTTPGRGGSLPLSSNVRRKSFGGAVVCAQPGTPQSAASKAPAGAARRKTE
jgi:hypothetical protein